MDGHKRGRRLDLRVHSFRKKERGQLEVRRCQERPKSAVRSRRAKIKFQGRWGRDARRKTYLISGKGVKIESIPGRRKRRKMAGG